MTRKDEASATTLGPFAVAGLSFGPLVRLILEAVTNCVPDLRRRKREVAGHPVRRARGGLARLPGGGDRVAAAVNAALPPCVPARYSPRAALCDTAPFQSALYARGLLRAPAPGD